MSGWEVERLVSRTKEVGCVPHPTKDDANGETGRLAAPNQGGAASRRAKPKEVYRLGAPTQGGAASRRAHAANPAELEAPPPWLPHDDRQPAAYVEDSSLAGVGEELRERRRGVLSARRHSADPIRAVGPSA